MSDVFMDVDHQNGGYLSINYAVILKKLTVPHILQDLQGTLLSSQVSHLSLSWDALSPCPPTDFLQIHFSFIILQYMTLKKIPNP